MVISAEQLSYWYLRLNGFLTIQNFVVHHRAENLIRPMRDDERFARHRNKSLIAITEVKTGLCSLNGPWTKPERNNMLRVAHAIGAFPKLENELVAKALYEDGFYSNQLYRVMLICMGNTRNEQLANDYPHVPQILWPEVLTFIYDRFREYRRQKASHGQWDKYGRDLWLTSEKSRSLEGFISNVQIVPNV